MSFDPSRLYAALLNTGLQQKDNPLYQVIHDIIGSFSTIARQTNSIISTGGFTGPAGATGIQGMAGTDGLDGDDFLFRPNPGIQDLISNFTQNSILFVGPSGYLAQNPTYLTWDNTNLVLSPTTIKAIGFIQVGPAGTFPGIAGDIQVNRGGGSPGTGAIYFGNTSSHFIFFDGTKFQFQDAVFSNGGFFSPTGILSNLVGKLQLGPAFTPPGIDGDLIVNRGGASPGTAAIFFGSDPAGAHNIVFNGTQLVFTDQLTLNAGFVVPSTIGAIISGKFQTGPAFTFPGVDGDIAVSRGIAPTTGIIYFGNSAGAHYIYWDAAKFNFTDQISVTGAATISGAFGCNTKAAQTAFASGGALAGYVTGGFGLDSDAHMTSLFNLVVNIRAALVANGIMS